MHGTLNVATMAAREAGNIIVRYLNQLDRIKISEKNSNELVSEVDLMAEQAIIDIITKHFPEHAIIGEESGNEYAKNKNSDHTWIIDPLDGTHNFLHGLAHCCVSIGIKKDNELEHAVVFDPFRNELFTATRGSGAQLDGKRIRVSDSKKLNESLLCVGTPFRDVEHLKPWLKTYATLLPRAQSTHNSGSAALDLAYVAAGRYDGIWLVGLKEWDIAAGALLVKEAGGHITNANGDTDFFATGDIIAGTPKIHEKLAHLVVNSK